MSHSPIPPLLLQQAPDILFLFGLAGCGKNYVADLIARHSDYHVYHADAHITPAMHQALAQQRPFTDAMRDEYFAQLIEKIRQLQTTYPRLLITQAVYKQKHRDFLLKNIAGMEMIWVSANDAIIEKRLHSRTQGIGLASAAALRNDFETPADSCSIIVNDSDDVALLKQLQNYPLATTHS